MKQLSINIFGNINNSPLLIAEGLRSLGHTVRLFVNRSDILHRPESKYPIFKDNYPDWILDYSLLTEIDFIYETELISKLADQLQTDADLVILNDQGPSLAKRLNVPHVVLLTGSDLTYYANFETLIIQTRPWETSFKNTPKAREYLVKLNEFIHRQRQGISTAKVVCFPHRGFSPLGDTLLESIGVSDDHRLHIHISNTDLLEPVALLNNQVLTILSPCRIVFQRESNPDFSNLDFKGTDILLKGYALYCQLGGTGELRLIKKGQDITAAAALAAELGIDERIVWLEEMTTYQLHQEMVAADLICDQFGDALPGLVTTDAYALGRPVMANLRNDIFAQVYPQPFPGFNARTPNEVRDWLLACDSDRSLLSALGKSSRIYAEEFLSPQKSAESILRHYMQDCGVTCV
jgi:glycosyltransferase involved in cell wall biosynthesis